ncbi:hypothetical protein FQN60_008035 [Etheostoma spectabile]|uniref:Uncharacterized protein n=1 Tax=Etheostoma spectabile TaxID=54343 RepID=A0A5J5CUM3_9PERO|nr:hypothetical protein FQN60_008035 [Etheostoma spectabile]
MAKSALGSGIGLLSAKATTSTASVTLKPSLSLLSPAIMSPSGVDDFALPCMWSIFLKGKADI